MAEPLRTTALTALASIPANPANLLFFAVDLSELDPDDQSKKMGLALLDSRFATAAQGSLAATALQSGAAFATAAQGVKADSALQAAAIGVTVQAYDAGLSAITAFGRNLIDDADADAGRATLVAAGTGVANTFTAAQTIQGALAVAPTTNAHSTSSIYTALVMGNLTGATADNGGLYAVARRVKVNEPFAAMSGWDTGSFRTVYIGGGGWSVPDATRILFYAAGTYNETNDGGAVRLAILPGGKIGLGNNFNVTTLADAALVVDPNGIPGYLSQLSTTAAVPVLRLKQLDLSEEFIRFESTIGAGNAIDTAALGAYYGKVRVYVEGVGAKWLALYDS